MTYDHLPKSTFPSLVDSSSQYSIAITSVVCVINLFYFSGTALVISYLDFEALLQILLLSGTAILISYPYFEAPLQIILLSVEKLDCCTSATVQIVKILKIEGETISELDGSLTARVYYDQNVALEEDRATPSTAVKVEHVALEVGSRTPSASVRVQSLFLSQCNHSDTEHGETANKEQVKEDNALKLDLKEDVHLVESERHSVIVEWSSIGAIQFIHFRDWSQQVAKPNYEDDAVLVADEVAILIHSIIHD
ncbi:hypothetical protein NE237_010936 [Protea cynaroides]|uniref:Uncharacterized protein n=1 Tax=Protea cynaroides TaxID=273540 RepID=A0A9Q0L0P9_9MAGN|nr:hypothetical protein NE237_010936 [Protea cynaroides]